MNAVRRLRVVPSVPAPEPAPLPAPRPKSLGMTRPVIRAWLNGEPVEQTCGRLAVENMARAFWQSRHDLLDPPQLVDLHELARSLPRPPTGSPPLSPRWWAGFFSWSKA